MIHRPIRSINRFLQRDQIEQCQLFKEMRKTLYQTQHMHTLLASQGGLFIEMLQKSIHYFHINGTTNNIIFVRSMNQFMHRPHTVSLVLLYYHIFCNIEKAGQQMKSRTETEKADKKKGRRISYLVEYTSAHCLSPLAHLQVAVMCRH